MNNQRMNVDKVSDDDLQDMFTDAFEKEIASRNNIDSFECICKRGGADSEIKMEVMVVGMAGSPTLSDYKDLKLKNTKTLTIEREGKGSLKFKLIPEQMIALNTNDYLAVYKAI